jgi:hypothetical protein
LCFERRSAKTAAALRQWLRGSSAGCSPAPGLVDRPSRFGGRCHFLERVGDFEQ